MPKRVIAASDPPATITSASFALIKRAASPIACAPVEHAETTDKFGPLKLFFIDTCPEAKLIKQEGIKKGLSLLGPFSFKTNVACSIVERPPIPEPINTPDRYESSSLLATHLLSLIAG